MSGRGDGLALAVVLVYGVSADGLMEALGPLRFAWVSLVVLALAVVLHSIPEQKKSPLHPKPTKARVQETV